MTASMTPLPCLGVPVETKALAGRTRCCRSCRCRRRAGRHAAIGKAGAVNAALLAAAVLALSDPAIAARLDRWRAEQTKKVAEEPREQA
jgi:5-(carboxyamino)imidazole ribonucleotide mutase